RCQRRGIGRWRGERPSRPARASTGRNHLDQTAQDPYSGQSDVARFESRRPMTWVRVAAVIVQVPRDAEAGRTGAKGETSRVVYGRAPLVPDEEPGAFSCRDLQIR